MSEEALDRIPLGERVTVRHRLRDGRATDSVGTLAARDAEAVTLQTRRGEVRVARDAVLVHRVVHPAPWRIATFLRRAGVAVLGHDSVVRSHGEDERGTPFADTVALVDELVAEGVPVFVLGTRSARGPEALEHVGLGRLVPWLLPTVEPGSTEPAPGAYAAAHARIEERLGREVARDEVRFTDGRPGNVEAARAFGWQARVFTPPQ